MKKALIFSALVAAVAAGCATPPKPTPDSRTAATNAIAAKAPLADTQCVRYSGTYIKRTDEKCRNIPGRSYSHDDIQGTGQLNAADALKQLDPTFH